MYEFDCTSEKMVELAIWMNDTNTNFRTFEWFDMHYHWDITNYRYKLIFSIDWVQSMAFYKWGVQMWAVTTKDYIVIYPPMITYTWRDYIKDFLKKYFVIEKPKRFDIALDVLIPIDDIVNDFKYKKVTGSEFRGAGWELETLYIWQKKKTNKMSLIRIYDKKKDIIVKNKQKIQADYLLEDSVTRIEIEFRAEMLRYENWENLFDEQFMRSLFFTHIRKNTTVFNSIVFSDIFLKRNRWVLDPECLPSTTLIKERTQKMLAWYAKSFLSAWSCPVDYLMRVWLMQETTIDDLIMKWYTQEATIRNVKQIFNGK